MSCQCQHYTKNSPIVASTTLYVMKNFQLSVPYLYPSHACMYTKMEKITILLLTLNYLPSPISCGSKELVLRYKSGNECLNNLAWIPIKSSTQLEEFTYCGQYYFRFLRPYNILMGLEPDTVLYISDFEAKSGTLKHGDIIYKFYFQNQIINPNSWQYICFAVSLNHIKVILNGEFLLNDKLVNTVDREIINIKLWFGGAPFYNSKRIKTRFEGMISKANLWNKSLKDNELISITTNDIEPIITSAAKYDIGSLISTEKNSTCIDYLILDKNDTIFQMTVEKILLIEYETDVNTSNYICQGLGGNLMLPKNEEDLQKIGFQINQSDVCDYASIGLYKSSDIVIQDLKGNTVNYMKWGVNQPNGKEFQKCISAGPDSTMYDLECHLNNCFACEISMNQMFMLRGPIPSDVERKYIVTNSPNNKLMEVRGIKETECFWNGTWNFGPYLMLDKAVHNMPPVGLKNWNGGQTLKFSKCKKHEFTCHVYGHCISMNKRCDGFLDCYADGSDENDCKTMTLEKGYDKKYSSTKNTTLLISMTVHNIIDIDELHMSYTVDIEIKVKWFDSRLTFRNLKPKKDENQLNKSEIDSIWTPKLFLGNSTMVYMKAGYEGDGTFGVVSVHKEGSSAINEFSEIDEDYLYLGMENPLGMRNYFIVKLGCKFDLRWYVVGLGIFLVWQIDRNLGIHSVFSGIHLIHKNVKFNCIDPTISTINML